MGLMETTRALDCFEFTSRVKAASMTVAAEKRADENIAEKALATQMFDNPGRPPEALAWMVAADPVVNELISVNEEMTVSVEKVTDAAILAAVRKAWPTVAGATG
ncbi:MAG: hypothetical protein J7474_02935 [Arthrobacter sp.]|nr:hypothetical protein [Arthrobacter sp.]